MVLYFNELINLVFQHVYYLNDPLKFYKKFIYLFLFIYL
jgi:hypothetical protein